MQSSNLSRMVIFVFSALSLSSCEEIIDMSSTDIIEAGNKTFVIRQKTGEILELLTDTTMTPVQDVEPLYAELNYESAISNTIVDLTLMITNEITYWQMRIAPNQSVVINTLPALGVADLNAIRSKLPYFVSDEGKKTLEDAFIVLPESDYMVFENEDEEKEFRSLWAENIRQDGNRINLLVSPNNSPLVLDDHRINLSMLQTRRLDAEGLAIEWSGYGKLPTQLDSALVQRYGGQSQIDVNVTYVLEI